ncbi:outer membrane protein assembly factor BamB family protein [Promicromonospora xylanilytica]
MARDPDQGGAFVFDLVDDGAADDHKAPLAGSGTDGGEAPDGEAGAAASGRPGGRARVLAPVAALLAVALGTGFVVDGLREDARRERMRDVPGGIVDVSSPLVEKWTWEGPVGSARAISEGRENEVALVGDLLTFVSDGELVALDPATGGVAWTAPLGADPDCGPAGAAGWSEVSTSTLVCLSGPAEDREAMVVGPDGVVAAGRPLAGADERRHGHARPGPDGLVLRAKRVGPEPVGGLGDADCTTTTGECVGSVEAGRDLELRAEDALTGEERWSVTVPFRTTEAGHCNNWSGSSWDGSDAMAGLDDMIDADAFSAHITGRLVQLYGCGIEAAVTATGVALGLDIEPGTGAVNSLRAGGYLAFRYEGEMRTTRYTAEGKVDRELDGYVFEPWTVDEPGPGTLLTAVDGERLRALEPDGTPRWETEMPTGAQGFFAQVAATAVIGTGTGTVYGLDLTTGEELWTWNGSDRGDGRTDGLYVMRGFTDGQSVLLVTQSGSGGLGLVALDPLSGEVVWEQEASTDVGDAAFAVGLVAVDGNLLEIAPDGVRGLG